VNYLAKFDQTEKMSAKEENRLIRLHKPSPGTASDAPSSMLNPISILSDHGSPNKPPDADLEASNFKSSKGVFLTDFIGNLRHYNGLPKAVNRKKRFFLSADLPAANEPGQWFGALA